RRRRTRLVPTRLGRLQRAPGREGVEPAAGALRKGTGLRPLTSRLARAGVCALLAIALPGRDAAAQPRQSPIVVFETENYAARGHGGNVLLRDRDPKHFRFS